jgi:hypothetical protein
LAQKKAKIGRPKLPKGEAKGRIVPVRFAPDDLKAIATRAKADKQNVSEWIRETVRLAINGSTYQPHTMATGGNGNLSDCPECRKLATNSLVPAICDSCKQKQMGGH